MPDPDPAVASLESIKAVPDMAEICLNVPLYETFPFEKKKHASKIRDIRYFRGHFDTHCLGCQRSSTFHCYTQNIFFEDNVICADGIFSQEFECSRDSTHKLLFIFRIEKLTLTKIGQFPSIADISKGEIDRYRKPLGSSRFSEFNRAIGLAAHGVGIGAFVYLRRVLEFLINDAHEIAKTQIGWDDDRYQKSRIGERIELLAAHLPAFLVENRHLYAIIPDGDRRRAAF